MQKVFESAIALFGLIVVSPLLCLVAVAVKVQDGGPVFYHANRVGKDGKLMKVHKFRTMIVDADREGLALTSKSDSRITRTGHFLRRFKLDEFPQLINVVKGEMSFVGPRPEDPRYVAHYLPEQRAVLKYLPGITSPASIEYRREDKLLTNRSTEETYLHEILPRKLAIELDYLTKRTIWTDFRVVSSTIWHIFL